MANEVAVKENNGKYYDWSQQRILTDSDGCPLSEWFQESERYSFAVHPSGFRIFLAPSDIELSDEYVGGDPYQVEVGINSPFQQRRLEITLEMLNECLPKFENLRILDVACGEGHITAKIAEAFPEAEISGFDYSVSAIEHAIELYNKDNIDFIVANAYKLPYPPDYFQIVVCNNIWEHVHDPLLMLQGIISVMNRGGYLVISTPSRYRLYNLLRVLIGKSVQFMSKMHTTEYSVGQVIEQLHSCGLGVVSIKSKPIPVQVRSLKSIIINKFIYPTVKNYLKLTNSHHSLESTVFYLAQKRSKDSPL
jgi:2-polyprenyl-3-methyl-5-hydroxy-6-metoxy-1,4-benzoquinol methylase